MSDFDIHNCNTQGYPKVKSIVYHKMFNISEIMILLFRTRYQILDIKDVPFLQKYSKLKIVKLEEFKRYHFCFHFED